MGAKPWATVAQAEYLHSQMPDYIRRQAERKLHLFWPPMQAGFFGKWPEHANLGLPLPDDPDARKLTDDELVYLGIAITARIKQLEAWFRYQRKKINTAADSGARGAGGGSAAALRTLFGLNASKRKRAHQPIEAFQIRNPELVNAALEEAGYNDKSAGGDRSGDEDNPNDSSDEAADTRPTRNTKSTRMRVRKRVVNALWTEASEEEKKACEDQVEAEKEKLREEELAEESKERTPSALQDAIDAVEAVYTDIHEATFNATGWVGMTILGGPNPRMNGELSLKIVCFGENSAGADFEQSCFNFDENVVEPFEAFVRMCYTAAECKARALPQAPPTTTITTDFPPRVPRVMPAPPAAPPSLPKTKKKSKKSKKSTGAETLTAPAAATISVSSIVPPPSASALDTSASPSIEAHPVNEGVDSDLQADTDMGTYPPSRGMDPSSLDNSKLFAFDDIEDVDLGDMDATAAPLDFDFDSFPAAPFPLFAALSPRASDRMVAPPSPVSVNGATDTMGGPIASTHPTAASLSHTRPLPRPLFGLRSAAAPQSTVNIGGFNFPVDTPKSPVGTPKSDHWRKSALFQCFRAPGTASASSTTTTPSFATTTPSSTITTAAASSTTTTTTTAASPSVADALAAAAAADTAISSPRKGVAYLQWRQQAGKAATTGIAAAGASTRSPTDAAATGAPTKAAQFLHALLQQSSAPAPPPPAATAPIPAAPRVTPQVDDEGDGVWAPVLPTTRPPTNTASAPAKKAATKKTPAQKGAAAAGKKPAVAATAATKEIAAKAAQKVSAVAGGAKRRPGRPPKVQGPPLGDATNVEVEAPVVRRYRAPVDHVAINFRRRSKEAAEKEKAAEKQAAEQEAADKRAAEIERGWAERVVEGTRTLTRVRKAPKHADGTEVQMEKKKAPAPVGTATSSKTRSGGGVGPDEEAGGDPVDQWGAPEKGKKIVGDTDEVSSTTP
ncbi:hypothetical protein B0H16DRAFT_1745735 [Mycena metata]|uniref:Uncharacterized protein n=1 Tax=Mycena metata TaxID=1033252 RepID=A0AAD7MC67_9AGAR|nr:hypothetical protein B0H16DRAFT_1745735 [Mycena metata]